MKMTGMVQSTRRTRDTEVAVMKMPCIVVMMTMKAALSAGTEIETMRNEKHDRHDNRKSMVSSPESHFLIHQENTERKNRYVYSYLMN